MYTDKLFGFPILRYWCRSIWRSLFQKRVVRI